MNLNTNINDTTVYVTKSKVESLIKSFNLKDNNNYKELIFSEILEGILAKPELKTLLDYKKILEGIDEIPLYPKADFHNNNVNMRLIYIGGNPSYHQDEDCKYLNSDYENYEIPEVIPKDRIEEYRSFFIDNKDLFMSKMEVFFARVELKFNVKIMNVARFDRPNSGISTTDNIKIMSLDKIREKIENLLTEMKTFKDKDESHTKEINRLGFGSHKAKYTDKDGNQQLCIHEQSSIIYKWHNYKSQLKYLIKQYYISDLNSDLNFNKNALQQCGFNPCKNCCK